MVTKIVSPQTAEQLDFIFGEIAEAADVIHRFGVLLVAAGVEEEADAQAIDAYHLAIKRLALQIGYAADLGCSKIGGVMVVRGDAGQWMMPPAYHAACEEASHG